MSDFCVCKNETKNTTATNHCVRTYFWWVRNLAPHLLFVHLPNWHFPLQLKLLLVHLVLSLHLFLQSSISQNLGVASKLTTLEKDSMFFFADFLLHLQTVFTLTQKNSTVKIGYIWFLRCILYHLIFGYPLCNVDSQQNNILLSSSIWFVPAPDEILIFILMC